MPTWAWWGLIAVGIFALGWLCGQQNRSQGPAGQGLLDTSWAVYFSPNGGATDAIIQAIRGAQRTILVHAYLLYSTRLAGALVHACQRGVQVQVILDKANAPRNTPRPTSWPTRASPQRLIPRMPLRIIR